MTTAGLTGLAGLEERLLVATAGVELTNPERPPADRVEVTPLGRALGADSRPLFAALLAAAVVLIVIAALNASSLMAARSVDRRRELAIRRALGATRGDLARLVFSESCVLLAAGTATGLLAAAPLLRFVSALLPSNVVLFRDAAIDWRVAVFSAAMTGLLAMLVVIWPFRLTAAGNSTLEQDRSGTSPTRARGGRLVVTSQVALALVLTVGGSLLVGSLISVYAKTPPITTDDVLTIEVTFLGMPSAVARDAPERARRVEALLDRVRSVPGVESVALTAYPLLVRAYENGGFVPPVTARRGAMVTHAVTADFYRVLQPQLIDGRWPTDLELRTAAPVIVVSERLAQAYWSGESAVGQSVTNHWKGRDSTSMAFTVVGVVKDVPWALWDEDPLGTLYGPYALLARQTQSTLLVQASSERPRLAEEILRVIEDTDPLARAGRVASLESVFVDSVRPRRFRAWLFGSFAVASLFVVGLGIFGQLAMSTVRRTREVGIRMACGATRGSIATLIVREQLVPVVAGVAIGCAVAAWAVRFVDAYLYQLTGADPRVWAAAICLILATAIAGTLVPSLRAARVNPTDALRAE
jgi:putative ABC transport system permease protein